LRLDTEARCAAALLRANTDAEILGGWGRPSIEDMGRMIRGDAAVKAEEVEG